MDQPSHPHSAGVADGTVPNGAPSPVSTAPEQPRARRRTGARRARRAWYWKYSHRILLPALVLLAGMTALVYPNAASWLSQYQASRVIEGYINSIDNAEPDKDQQLQLAHLYNDELRSEAVYEPGKNIPLGRGRGSGKYPYEKMLSIGDGQPMARLQIPKIDLDLPVYHGTSDETLLEGLGHLEGTSLPVGGIGTRSVITGHRGLAEAEMFTNLDKVGMDDMFYIQVFGEVLRYKVVDIKVIDPEDTQALQPDPDRDLVTLVTCTPLGINSQRILVTGERSEPVSADEAARANGRPDVPRFPWFGVGWGLGVLGILFYLWWGGVIFLPPVHRRPGQLFRREETLQYVTSAAPWIRGLAANPASDHSELRGQHVILLGSPRVGLSTFTMDLLPDYLETLGWRRIPVRYIVDPAPTSLGGRVARVLRRLVGRKYPGHWAVGEEALAIETAEGLRDYVPADTLQKDAGAAGVSGQTAAGAPASTQTVAVPALQADAAPTFAVIELLTPQTIRWRKKRHLRKLLAGIPADAFIIHGLRHVPGTRRFLASINTPVIGESPLIRQPYTYVPIRPLSYAEFTADWPADAAQTWRDYAAWGGYPGVWSPTTSNRTQYLRRVVPRSLRSYLRRVGKALDVGMWQPWQHWAPPPSRDFSEFRGLERRSTKRLLRAVTTSFGGRVFLTDPGLAHLHDASQPDHPLWLLLLALQRKGWSPTLQPETAEISTDRGVVTVERVDAPLGTSTDGAQPPASAAATAGAEGTGRGKDAQEKPVPAQSPANSYYIVRLHATGEVYNLTDFLA